MLQLTIIMVVTFIFTGIIIAITPYITRRETVFGVFIPEGRTSDPFVVKKKKDFFLIILVLCLLMCIPFVFFGNNEEMMNLMAIYITVAILAYCFISYGIYYLYHRQMKSFKETFPSEESDVENQKIVISTGFNKENKVVSNFWFAGVNIVIILATILVPIFFYDRIPYQVPVHWGVDGEVTRYRERNISMFLSFPLFQLGMLTIMLVINHGIKKAKQKLNVENPKVSRAQNIAFRYAMSKLLFAMATLVSLLFLLIQCFMVFGIQEGNYILIATIIILVPSIGGSLYIAIRYGQGGERLRVNEKEANMESGSTYDDDKYWKMGLFYFNPKDPTVWVEKRFGLGMTINFGSPIGIMLMVGLIVVIIVLMVISFLL